MPRMGKFLIRKVKSGIKFDLKAANGQTVLTSEVYTSQASCRKGMESIRKAAPLAPVEDLTESGQVQKANPKFEVYTDKNGQFRFRLKSRNGKIIGISDGYRTKAGAFSGIESVKNNAPDAEVEEA